MSPLRLVRRGNKQMAILWIRRSFIAWHKSYFTRKSSVGCEIGIIQKSLKEVVLGRLNTKNPLKSLYPTCVFKKQLLKRPHCLPNTKLNSSRKPFSKGCLPLLSSSFFFFFYCNRARLHKNMTTSESQVEGDNE